MKMRTKITEECLAMIEAQQPPQRSAVWMVGEQLKDMVCGDEAAAQLVLTDLREGGMTLAEAEKRIAERAKKNKVGNCGCVTPAEAEEILREYFGLGAPTEKQPDEPVLLDLADFL